MKLIKTTRYHFIYELSEKEQKSPEVNGYKYVLFLKENYEDYKPSFKYDIGCQDWEADSLKEAMAFSKNY